MSSRKSKLSPSMSVAQFDNGYWFALGLKRFAHELGIPSVARLRKDQLEGAIRGFLRTRRLPSAPPSTTSRSARDIDLACARTAGR